MSNPNPQPSWRNTWAGPRYDPPTPPKKARHWPWIVGIVVGLFVIIGVASNSGDPKPATTTAPTTVAAPAGQPTSAAPEAPAAPAPAAAPAGPLTTVSDGTYEVGVDMVAGTYKGQCTDGYWMRSKDGTLDTVIANDLKPGPAHMQFTAKKGEFVEVSRCTFTKS